MAHVVLAVSFEDAMPFITQSSAFVACKCQLQVSFAIPCKVKLLKLNGDKMVISSTPFDTYMKHIVDYVHIPPFVSAC